VVFLVKNTTLGLLLVLLMLLLLLLLVLLLLMLLPLLLLLLLLLVERIVVVLSAGLVTVVAKEDVDAVAKDDVDAVAKGDVDAVAELLVSLFKTSRESAPRPQGAFLLQQLGSAFAAFNCSMIQSRTGATSAKYECRRSYGVQKYQSPSF
jgi:hypothetical protein